MNVKTQTGFVIACSLHAIAGCSESGSHIYEGRFYNEGRDCVGTGSTVDVVDGTSARRDCPIVCLLQKRPDGGRVLYTSTMCAPFPFDFDTSGNDPKCAAAVAAHARNDTCFSDGGSSAPLPKAQAEAGPDAGDAGDASTD